MQFGICCSSRTRHIADRLEARLLRNLGIKTVIEAADAPVTETWEAVDGGAALLLILDGITAPAPFRRADWQSLEQYAGPPRAWLRTEQCAYPKFIERQNFHVAAEPPEFDRSIEKWLAPLLPQHRVLSPEAIEAEVPDDWWKQLVDEPGHIEVPTRLTDSVQRFAHLARPHFQSVAWVGCYARDPESIAGELESALTHHRTLVILANADEAIPLPSGRHSFITIKGSPKSSRIEAAAGACYPSIFPQGIARHLDPGFAKSAVRLDEHRGLYRFAELPRPAEGAQARHLDAVLQPFLNWRNDPEPCRRLLYEVEMAAMYGFEEDWEKGSKLLLRAGQFLADEKRVREAVVYLKRLINEAMRRGDASVAAEAAHELSWLTDADGTLRKLEPMPTEQPNLFG